MVVCALHFHVTARIGIAAKVGTEDVSLVLERGQKVLCDNITFSGCRTPRSFHRSTAAMGGKVDNDCAFLFLPIHGWKGS